MTSETGIAPDVLVRVLKDDLAAVDAALERGGVSDVVVFANRFISNATLFAVGPQADALLFVGLTIRITGEDLIQVSARRTAKDPRPREALEAGQEFVAAIGRLLPNADQEIPQVGRALYEFRRRVVADQQTPEEQTGYAELVDLRGGGRRVLSGFLSAHADALMLSRGRLVDGLVNELTRLMRVHAFDERDLCFFLALRSMSLVDGYYKYLLTPFEGEKSPPSTQPLIDQQKALVASIPAYLQRLESSEVKQAWVATQDFVAPILRRWREFFLLYMDLPTPAPQIGIIARPPAEGTAARKKEEFVEARKRK